MGMIHIYCGDGKGKTTAAVGLAVRAAGAGKKVVFSQFFKDGSSSELKILRTLPNVSAPRCGTVRGWFLQMTEEERARAARDYGAYFREVAELASGADLLVLDEICFACRCGAVAAEDVTAFLERRPEGLEVVLTGRDPAPELLALADYVTRMEKEKHPFDRGVPAREGIEY